jgi:hypothetical protein
MSIFKKRTLKPSQLARWVLNSTDVRWRARSPNAQATLRSLTRAPRSFVRSFSQSPAIRGLVRGAGAGAGGVVVYCRGRGVE